MSSTGKEIRSRLRSVAPTNVVLAAKHNQVLRLVSEVQEISSRVCWRLPIQLPASQDDAWSWVMRLSSEYETFSPRSLRLLLAKYVLGADQLTGLKRLRSKLVSAGQGRVGKPRKRTSKRTVLPLTERLRPASWHQIIGSRTGPIWLPGVLTSQYRMSEAGILASEPNSPMHSPEIPVHSTIHVCWWAIHQKI